MSINTDLAEKICQNNAKLAELVLSEQADDARALLLDLSHTVRADAAAKELAGLRTEIRRRQAVADLLAAVTPDALRVAAQAGYARWHDRNGVVVIFSWLRSYGWAMAGHPSWTDGQRVALEANLVRELYAQATAPVLEPLAAYFRAIVTPLPAVPDHHVPAERVHWLVDAVAEARKAMEFIPEVGSDIEPLIAAAGAATAFYGPDREYQSLYLVARGWQRLSQGDFNFALPNGTGGSYGAAALKQQADRDFEPYIKTWPAELARAEKPIVRKLEPAGA